MHLRAHGRVQAVGRDQQRPRHFQAFTAAGLDQGRDAIGILPVARHPLAQPHGTVAQAVFDRVEQQHLQLPPVHRVLRPAVAGLQAAGFGVDLAAVAAHQRPFACLQADGVQHVVAEPQVVQLAHGIGLQVDADAQRLQLGHRFEHDAGHADLVQREGGGHAADTATGDQDGAGQRWG